MASLHTPEHDQRTHEAVGSLLAWLSPDGKDEDKTPGELAQDYSRYARASVSEFVTPEQDVGDDQSYREAQDRNLAALSAFPKVQLTLSFKRPEKVRVREELSSFFREAVSAPLEDLLVKKIAGCFTFSNLYGQSYEKIDPKHVAVRSTDDRNYFMCEFDGSILLCHISGVVLTKLKGAVTSVLLPKNTQRLAPGRRRTDFVIDGQFDFGSARYVLRYFSFDQTMEIRLVNNKKVGIPKILMKLLPEVHKRRAARKKKLANTA